MDLELNVFFVEVNSLSQYLVTLAPGCQGLCSSRTGLDDVLSDLQWWTEKSVVIESGDKKSSTYGDYCTFSDCLEGT